MTNIGRSTVKKQHFLSGWMKVTLSRQVYSFLLLGDLLLKFSQQGILRIFVNLRFVLDILRTVSISVFIK